MKSLFLNILTLTYTFCSSYSKPLKSSNPIMPNHIEIEKQKLFKFPDDFLPSQNNNNNNNNDNNNNNNNNNNNDNTNVNENQYAKINETKRILEEIEKINKSLGYHKRTEETPLKFPTLIWNSDEYLFPSDNLQPFHTQSLLSLKLRKGNSIYTLIPISLLEQQSQQERVVKSHRGEINSKSPNSFHYTNGNYLRLFENVQLPKKEEFKSPILLSKYYYEAEPSNGQHGYEGKDKQEEFEIYQPLYAVMPIGLFKLENYHSIQQQQQQQQREPYPYLNTYSHSQQQHQQQQQKEYHIENYRDSNINKADVLQLRNTLTLNNGNNNNNKRNKEKYHLEMEAENILLAQSEPKILSKNTPTAESEAREDKLFKDTQSKPLTATSTTRIVSTITTTTAEPQSMQTFSKRSGLKPSKTKEPNASQIHNNQTGEQQKQEQPQIKFLSNSKDDLNQELSDTVQGSLKGVFHNIFKLPFKQDVKPQAQSQTEYQSLSTKPPKPIKIPQLLQFSTLAASNSIVMQAQQQHQQQQQHHQQQQQQQLLSDLDYTDYRWEDEGPINYQLYQNNNNNNKTNKTIHYDNTEKFTDYEDSDEISDNEKFLGHHHHRLKQDNSLKTEVEKDALKRGGIIINKLKIRKGGIAIAGPGGVATAGSGGTAIVGPGGYVLTHPRSLSIAGPGAKVIAIPENIDLKDALQQTNSTKQLIPREGRIVATGPIVYYAPPTHLTLLDVMKLN